MRIRPSIFLVSSVLLTPGFLWLLPSTIYCVRSRDSMTQIAGLAGLTLIIVALIVIWTGVAAGTRIAWVTMAVIVWVWALPAMMWPVLRHGRRWTLSELSEWGVIAWREGGFARTNLVSTAMFLLMLVGLVLPVRALFRFRIRKGAWPTLPRGTRIDRKHD
jgi:hypothetical protein